MTGISRREFMGWLAAVALAPQLKASNLLAEVFDPSLMEEPHILPAAPIKPEFLVRGLYAPGWKGVTNGAVGCLMDLMARSGSNTLMIDIKNSWGELFYFPRNSLARTIGAQARTITGSRRALVLEHLFDQARKKGFRIIARHVMFRDIKLYDFRSDLRMWKNSYEKWVDLRKNEVLDYNMDLLDEEAALGFDEIVLDYIRFPGTETFGSCEEKCRVIDEIVERAWATVKSRNVDLGVQVFGYTAWHHKKAGVGQRISTLDPHADVIYPMLYPSHFWPGSFGFSNPSDHPYEIISRGYQEAVKKVQDGTRIIPMIQAFWYSEEEIKKQLKAVHDSKMPGYICWNPSGRYNKVPAPSAKAGTQL